MRKKIIIIALPVLLLVAYLFRFELLFTFQYSRLKGLACQTDNSDFINDSCLNKIWAHRVNSIGRYNQLKGKFAGYEADVVWDTESKHFLVYHPPLEHAPMMLDHLLYEVRKQKEMLWLDLRQTNTADSTAMLAMLEGRNNIYDLKMNAIFEVYDISAANLLAEHGYWVALNINTEWIQKFSRASQWQELRNSMSPKISFVSQEDVHIPLLKKHFPGKDIITWSTAFKNYFNRQHFKELVSDANVKVVLVNVKSRYYQ